MYLLIHSELKSNRVTERGHDMECDELITMPLRTHGGIFQRWLPRYSMPVYVGVWIGGS